MDLPSRVNDHAVKDSTINPRFHQPGFTKRVGLKIVAICPGPREMLIDRPAGGITIALYKATTADIGDNLTFTYSRNLLQDNDLTKDSW